MSTIPHLVTLEAAFPGSRRPSSLLPLVWPSSPFVGGGDNTEVAVQGNRHWEKGMVRFKLTRQLRGRVKTRPTKGFP